MDDLKELAESCFHTFNSDVGKKFLKYLVDTYFMQTVYAPGISFDHAAYNEGRRSVVDEILGLNKMYLTGEYPATSYNTEEDSNG